MLDSRMNSAQKRKASLDLLLEKETGEQHSILKKDGTETKKREKKKKIKEFEQKMKTQRLQEEGTMRIGLPPHNYFMPQMMPYPYAMPFPGMMGMPGGFTGNPHMP